MTGGLVMAVMSLWERAHSQSISFPKYAGIAGVFLFVACFLAWRGEYRNRLSADETGSLAFSDVHIEFNRHGDLADPQVAIVLKNQQSRLIQYTVESVDVVIEGKRPTMVFANHGGYIYGGQTGIFRLPPVMNVPINGDPLNGRLRYNIRYTIAGGRAAHITGKTMAFHMYYGESLAAKFEILEEHED